MVLAVTLVEILDLAFSIVIGVLYGAVAWIVGTRSVSGAARSANLSFATWWWGLVVLTFFGSLWTILHWFVAPSLPLWISYITFLLLLIMVAFAGLLYYFLYLWSGNARLWVPVSLFYLAMFVASIYYIMVQDPNGFDADGQVVYGNDLSDSIIGPVLGVLLLMPTVIGAALYLGLLRKAKSRLMRFRIGLVASSIMVWFLISITSSFSNINDASWWNYVSDSISAVVAALTLVAYKPPAKIRAWLHLDEGSLAALDPDLRQYE